MIAKTELSKGKKTAFILLAVVFIVMIISSIIYISLDLTNSIDYAAMYSEQEHIARVTKLAKNRFFNDKNKNYTDMQVYPLYDENDELSYFLIEFKQSGFVIVKLNKNHSEIRKSFSINGMYLYYDTYTWQPWQRYRLLPKNSQSVSENGTEYAYCIDGESYSLSDYDLYCETDNAGEFVYYKASPYSVANAMQEKMYMLEVKTSIKNRVFYVPAIKCGDNWINLISSEKFDLEQLGLLYGVPSLFIYFPITMCNL